MAIRGQAYRLDWQGDAQTLTEVNRRLAGLWIKTDEMIQSLFKRIKAGEDNIALLEEEVEALNALGSALNQVHNQFIPLLGNDDVDENAATIIYNPINTPTFTQGSVIFAGPSGRLSQNNANLFWDNTNNRLGILTASPSVALHVKESTNTFDVLGRVENTGTNANSGTAFDVNTGSVASRWFTSGENATDPRMAIGTVSSHPLAFFSINTEVARLKFIGSDAFFALGGNTSSFPALKRNTTNLDVRLADDSAYSGVNSSVVRLGGTTSSFPMVTNNGARLKVRLADDSNYAEQDTGSIHINNGSSYINIGPLSGVPTFGGLSFTSALSTITAGNYSLLGDGTNTYFNAPSGGTIFFRINNTTEFTLTPAHFGIGSSLGTATAQLHIQAGTAAATTAPLKLTAGTNMTSPEAGAIEWDGTHLFATQTSGPTRKTLAYTTDIPSFPSVVASTFEKSETGSDANVLTYTTGGADEFLNVQVATDVSAITGTSVVVTATWKDSNNATATSTLTISAVGDGTMNIPINAKTATSVVISTVFVGVSTAYKISTVITRLV